MTTLTPERIRAALLIANGNKSRAARILGISRPTLYKYLRAEGSRTTETAGTSQPAESATRGTRQASSHAQGQNTRGVNT